MLVLTRRADETIVIDGHIRITVMGLRGDTVRLGITAPRSVRVDREEIHRRRKADEEGGTLHRRGERPGEQFAGGPAVPGPPRDSTSVGEACHGPQSAETLPAGGCG